MFAGTVSSRRIVRRSLRKAPVERSFDRMGRLRFLAGGCEWDRRLNLTLPSGKRVGGSVMQPDRAPVDARVKFNECFRMAGARPRNFSAAKWLCKCTCSGPTAPAEKKKNHRGLRRVFGITRIGKFAKELRRRGIRNIHWPRGPRTAVAHTPKRIENPARALRECRSLSEQPTTFHAPLRA